MEVISETSKRKIEEIIEDEPPDKKYCSENNKEVECLNGFNNNSKELNVKDCVDNVDKCEKDVNKYENDVDKYEKVADKCEDNDITDVLEALKSQLDQPEMSAVDADIEKSEHSIAPNVNELNENSTNAVPRIDDNESNSEVQCNTDPGVGDQLNNSNVNVIQNTNSDNAISTNNRDNNSDLNMNQHTNSDNATSANNGDNHATTVNTQTVPREKCKYGSHCYRLNAEHKTKFSHVGDADYDIPDNRPECPYGMNCYRINPVHKQNYKHTRNKRQAAIHPVHHASHEESDSDQSIQESVDESDYDPSFIDDDDIDSLEGFESDFED